MSEKVQMGVFLGLLAVAGSFVAVTQADSCDEGASRATNGAAKTNAAKTNVSPDRPQMTPEPARALTVAVEVGLDEADARALALELVAFCGARSTRRTWTRIESIAVSHRKWSGEDAVWELTVEPNRKDGPPMTYWIKLDRSAIASGPFGECALGEGSVTKPAYFPFGR